jgi:adenosylcobinamide-GDP ribazoletransferase
MRGFFIALQFLTRVPVPWIKAREEEIGPASAFFPLVGVVVGSSASLVFAGLSHLLPTSTSVIFVLVFLVLITNGFHEDGFADALDGFGGGWTKEAALGIMKDSRIGSFGALGLVFLVIAKYNLLGILDASQIWRWLIFAHTASRWSALPLCLTLDYARPEGRGKVVARAVPRYAFIIGTLTLLLASLVFSLKVAAVALAVTACIVVLSGIYYRRRLNGVTGDCLGATNQLIEVSLYLTAVLLTRRS